LEKKLAFLRSKPFYKKKIDKFYQISGTRVNVNEKRLSGGNLIHNFILCISENFCDTILLWFRNRNKLRFRFRLFEKLQFRFDTAKSYGSYGSLSGSGSTTRRIFATCVSCVKQTTPVVNRDTQYQTAYTLKVNIQKKKNIIWQILLHIFEGEKILQ
jgi:hypothetical protein